MSKSSPPKRLRRRAMRENHPEIWPGDRHYWYSLDEWTRTCVKSFSPRKAFFIDREGNITQFTNTSRDKNCADIPSDAVYLGQGRFHHSTYLEKA